MKPKQIILLAVAAVALLAAIVIALSSGDPLKARANVYLIDVEQGTVYRANPRERGIVLPARRPDGNKERALVRLDRKDTGEYFVNDRDRAMINALDPGVQNKFVDATTGQLSKPFTGSGATSYDPP